MAKARKMGGTIQSRRTTVLGATLAVALAVVLGGCGDDEVAVPDTTTSTTSTTVAPTTTSSTTTTVDPEVALHTEILDGYRAAIAAFYEAGDPPNPDHPALAATTTGAMLQYRFEDLTDLAARGAAVRLPENPRRRVELIEGTMRVEGDVALFEACGLDDSREVVGPAIPSDGRIWTATSRVTMEFVDGVWKLSGRVPGEIVEGVTGCAEGWD